MEKMCAALVKVHAAFLINERLQQLQFRVGEQRRFAGIHGRSDTDDYFLPAAALCAATLLLLVAEVSVVVSGFAACRKSNTFPTSSKMMRRPWYLPSPVTQSNPSSSMIPGAGSISLLGIFNFFVDETTTTQIYTLSRHDARPSCRRW